MDSISLDDIKKRKQWLVWRLEMNEKGEETKVSYSPITGRKTGCNEPYRPEWTTYDEAFAYASSGGFPGVGVVFTDGLNGIDIDHKALDDAVVQDVLSKVCSYTEKSPSGEGLHILFTLDADRLPDDFVTRYRENKYYKNNRKLGLECYLPNVGGGARWFTFTEDIIFDHPIEDCTEGVVEFLDAYMRKPEPSPRTQIALAPIRTRALLTDDEVISKARTATNGEKFAGLWDGDTSVHNDDDSAADLALCNILAYWCGGDKVQMDRLFRQSGLMRDKWERDDYREWTLDKALEGGAFAPPAGIVLPFGLDKGGKPSKTIDNVLLAMREDPRLAGRIGFDSLAYALTVRERMPWDTEGMRYPREWTDNDDSGLKWYLQKVYDLTGRDVVADALRITEMHNRYSPVRDLLDTLEWDGEERIVAMLAVLLGVRHRDMEVAAVVMELFMQGAVARAYQPGCKFDYMPVLVGRQGCGKSTFVRKLAINPQWHRDNFPTFEGKDAIDNLRGKWINEASELSALNRARDAEVVKSFLTSAVDEYREAYARRTTVRPRACLFIGTTNKHNFLSDPTGNRRFIPIEVGTAPPTLSVHDAEADEFIMQCWAEAVHYHKSGRGSLVIPPELEAKLNSYQEAFEVDDGRVGLIQEYLDKMPADSAVCVYEICEQALGLDGAYYKGNRTHSKEICSILDHKVRGWVRAENRQRFPEYGSQWCWVRE
jgi:hypothetical protein